jgi:glycosyltransferase involved in cell wall biosynthesis
VKIGFLTPLYVPDIGGAEILLDRLVRSLQTRGHEAIVIAPRRRGKHLPAPQYPVIRTLKPFSKRFGLHHALPNLLYAYWRHRFELLHCHGEYRAAYVARTFKRITGVPYVVRALGGGFTTVEENPQLRPRLEKALRAADGLIAQGAFLHNKMLAAGVPPERIITIHNGVDAKELMVEGPRPCERDYILYLGGLRPVKGYDVLVRAFAAIADTVPTVDLIIAGTDQDLAAFQRLLADTGMAPARVHYVGQLAREQVALYCRHALIYVCPFRKSPFSNANLEAMASGAPIIATAVDGNIEQIRDGIDGILVPSDDSEALAAAMHSVALDADLRGRLAAGAARRAGDFSWEVMVEKFEVFYANTMRLRRS